MAMMVQNDHQRGLVNGTVGRVSRLVGWRGLFGGGGGVKDEDKDGEAAAGALGLSVDEEEEEEDASGEEDEEGWRNEGLNAHKKQLREALVEKTLANAKVGAAGGSRRLPL